jgi:hypothetical protein
MPREIDIYSEYMTGVRMRIDHINSTLASENMPQFAKTEMIFLQLRKALELVAFASLAANRDAYSGVHPTFGEDWNAKRILKKIEKINAEFYPMALNAPEEIAQGRKHFSRPLDDFMTKEEFVILYDTASEVLHTRNPFTDKEPTIQIKYTVPEWVARIQRLLTWHQVRLISGDLWVVCIPAKGEVQVWPAAALN